MEWTHDSCTGKHKHKHKHKEQSLKRNASRKSRLSTTFENKSNETPYNPAKHSIKTKKTMNWSPRQRSAQEYSQFRTATLTWRRQYQNTNRMLKISTRPNGVTVNSECSRLICWKSQKVLLDARTTNKNWNWNRTHSDSSLLLRICLRSRIFWKQEI